MGWRFQFGMSTNGMEVSVWYENKWFQFGMSTKGGFSLV